MDMSQYRDLFLTETREHLNNMNSLVVNLEQSPGDCETLDALFREAHSIKGMAASMGYDRTAELSHHLEDFLDGFRSGKEISAEAIDRVLAGIDLLEGLLDDLLCEQPERSIESFLDQASSEVGEEPVETVMVDPEEFNDGAELPMFAIEENDGRSGEPNGTASATESGREVEEEPETFQVLVDLDENATAPAARGLLILGELCKAGDILSSKPTEADLRGGSSCQQVQAWLRTSLSKEQVEEGLLGISGVKRVGFVDDRRKDQCDEKVSTVRIRTDLLDQLVNLTGELITHRYMLETAAAAESWSEMSAALSQTGRLIDTLHHNVLQARLMPLESVTARLPRVVRDLARKTDRKVTLKVVGADVGIDRMVLEQLGDPLLHLVRNAVDHGICDAGTVTISARREKDIVLIGIADDGIGMDPVAIKQRAVARGLLNEAQAELMADHDALMLVCQPGFSTTEQVTETSGRGVGMDVVKAAVENLGGSLDIQSERGVGTHIQLRLPLSVAIIKTLLVACAGRTLAIPITRVLRTLDLDSAAVRLTGRQRVFELEEELVPLVALAGLLGLAEPIETGTTWTVLTEVQGRRIGLQVDRFLGQREAFVKSLDFPLNALSGLSGATVEGDGRVIFIIDPQTLLEGHAAVTGAAVEDAHAISPYE